MMTAALQRTSGMHVLCALLIGALTIPMLLLTLAWVRWSEVLANVILIFAFVDFIFGIAILSLALLANIRNKSGFPAITIRLAVAATLSPVWLLPPLFLAAIDNLDLRSLPYA
jgi:predicted lysophospholipase L1 biosynthesis ABC-type transport system permease subunit